MISKLSQTHTHTCSLHMFKLILCVHMCDNFGNILSGNEEDKKKRKGKRNNQEERPALVREETNEEKKENTEKEKMNQEMIVTKMNTKIVAVVIERETGVRTVIVKHQGGIENELMHGTAQQLS